MKLLFRGGTLVTAEAMIRADLLTDGEKIAAIGERLPAGDAQVVEMAGKLLLPGAIDAHTHLECVCSGIDTSDDYFTGTRAAACGGTTTVIDYLLQEPGEPLPRTLAKRVPMAAGKAAVDFAFHIGVSDLSTPELLASVGDAVAAGVSSFKAYMVYDFGLTDEALYTLLQETARVGALVTVHAENRGMLAARVKQYLAEGKTEPWWHYLSRSEEVAAEATRRVIALAKAANAPLYIVHLTDADSAAAVTAARDGPAGVRRNLPAVPELYQRRVPRPACAGLRVLARHQGARLAGGALGRPAARDLATVTTDHCPLPKRRRITASACPTAGGNFTTIPNGCDGVETMYPYLLTQANLGRIPYTRAVAACATNPAKLFGLDDRKGALRPGLDADLAVFDPKEDGVVRARELHGNLDHTIWENTALHGRVTAAYLRGNVIFENGMFTGAKGAGRFLKCNPVAPENSAFA
jgi:dihydropyrimidinase